MGVEEGENTDSASTRVNGSELIIDGITENGYIEIFDISGKLLFNRLCYDTYTTIDISNYKKGIYILRIKDTNGVQTQKLYIK